MTDHYGSDIIGSYNNFRHYIWKNDMKPIKNKEVHVRFETPPGVQMQVDWKENMKITTKHGEIIAFNILTATLGYSRLHIFIYSRSKTTEDFIRCVIDALQILGGAPRHILTENMSAVVSITN